jgi:malate/lactate dehydrogenase
MYNEFEIISATLTTNGVEKTLNTIDIEDVEDHTLKIILRTLKHSLERLHEELN